MTISNITGCLRLLVHSFAFAAALLLKQIIFPHGFSQATNEMNRTAAVAERQIGVILKNFHKVIHIACNQYIIHEHTHTI